MSICCFATRYVFATLKLDIFLAFARNSICCLTATRVDSAATQIVTSLALPNGNAYRARQRHIECVSTISSDAQAAHIDARHSRASLLQIQRLRYLPFRLLLYLLIRKLGHRVYLAVCITRF